MGSAGCFPYQVCFNGYRNNDEDFQVFNSDSSSADGNGM